MRIKAVGFDFDGTLFDSFSNGLKSAKDMFREIGRPFTRKDERIIRDAWGDTLTNILAALFPDETPAVRERHLERWVGHSRTREKHAPSRLFPGVNQTVKNLHRLGIVIAIATNRKADKLYEVLLGATLDVKQIDFIIAWNPSRTFAKFLEERTEKPIFASTPYKKPDRRYLAKLNRYLAKRGIMPHEVIFCGDALFDAFTAEAGGYNFVPVLTGPAGKTTGWWEYKLREHNLSPLTIATSIRDIPLMVKAFNTQ